MSIKFKIDFNHNHLSTSDLDLRSVEKDLVFEGNNGCTVILIHGLTGSPYEMLYLAKYLTKKNYTVVCPRLANHGKPMETFKKTKWQECYQSIRDCFLEIKSRNNNQHILVAGLSIGAVLGLLLADEFNSEISAVCCMSPILFYDGWNSPKARYLLPLVYLLHMQEFFYFKEEAPYGIKNETIRQRLHDYYNTDLNNLKDVERYGYPYYPVTLLYQHQLLTNFVKKRIPHIATPIQIIQSAEDDISSAKNAYYIYNRIRSDIKELVFLSDCYHVITMDQERKKVAENLERFFNGIIKKDNETIFK